MEVKNSKNKQKRDIELINRIKKGDEKAFEELVNLYKKPVFYTIKRLVGNEQDAEDLTNEVFIKLFFNIDMYNPVSNFSTWLFRIASNHSIDFLRKKKLQSVPLEINEDTEDGKNWLKTLSDEELSPEQDIIKKQEIEELKKVLNLLPEQIRELIELKYYKNMQYKEIAEKLQIPLGTVKARLHRAKKLLNILIKKHLKK